MIFDHFLELITFLTFIRPILLFNSHDVHIGFADIFNSEKIHLLLYTLMETLMYYIKIA